MNSAIGFCDCGLPDENALYVLGGLKLVGFNRPQAEYDQWLAERIAYHGSERAWEFFLYWADAVNLTGHGGSVTACWLSSEGKEMVERLEKAKAQAEAAKAQGELCL